MTSGKHVRTLLLLTYCLFRVQTACTQSPAQSRFDSVMQAYGKLNWNATVLVGDLQGIRYQHSIGFSDIPQKQPLTPQTLFHTASVGKMFTATRIMQLVKAGKIDLNKPIGTYIIGWRLPNIYKITIHHLLTHTSGLASAWDHPNYDFKKQYTADEVKHMMEEVPLVFQTPGERYYYSNIGYTLLGEAIARIDNMPFAQSIEKHIFRPAGIILRKDATIKQFAIPYYQVSSTDFVIDEESKLAGYKAGEGAGGWLLTTHDLYLFAKAWLQGKYLDSTSRRLQQTANHTIDSAKNNFRYGLALLNGPFARPHTIFGHNGGGKGFTTDAFFDPATGLIVIMASNQWSAGYTITSNLFRAAYGEPIVVPEPIASVKLIDHIQQSGTALLLQKPDSFFARLNVPFTTQVIYRTYNLLEIAQDYEKAAALLAAGTSKYPKERYLWYNRGIIASKQHVKAAALNYFNEAKQMANSEKDELLLQQIATQLQLLQ